MTRVLLTLFILLGSVACTATAQVESMTVLTIEVGWAANGQRLFWTNDNGANWSDITPKKPSAEEHIAAVFFLSTSTGWVLWSQEAEPQPRFDLSSTADAGASWESVRIPIAVSPVEVPLSETARMFFLDGRHGWIDATVQGSAAAHRGAMLTTEDGGRTWDWKGMVSRGSAYFSTPKVGWIVSPEGDELDVTHDGSNTWDEVSLTPPLAMKGYMTTYHLPRLIDTIHGYIEAEFSDGTKTVRTLFSTSDGGITWKFDRRLPEVRYAASQLFDSVWIAASAAVPGSESSVPGRELRLTKVPLAGDIAEAEASRADVAKFEGLRGLGRSEISFADISHGWVLPGTLLSTTDGGTTWSDITPPKLRPAHVPSIFAPAPSKPKASTSPNPRIAGQRRTYAFAASNDISIHLGFDIIHVIPSGDMQKWWQSSPYFDTNLYLPGSPNRLSDPNLTAAWVEAAQGLGWGLVPTWFGLQSPCACKTGSPPNCFTFYPIDGQFSSNANIAKAQGVQEADAAIASLQNLQSQGTGIALGTIIYHDIENYAPSSSCCPPVKSFVSGWVSELQAKGYQGGVYANPSPISSDVSKVSPLPDDIWVAKGDNRVTTLGLSFSDSLWPKNQRIHQYFQDRKQAFGGTTTYQIDADIDDAQIAAGLGDKLYTGFTFSDVVYPGAFYTFAEGINDLNSAGTMINNGQTGQIVGSHQHTTPCCPPPHFGFMDNSGAYTAISTSLSSPIPTGINNQGIVVGSYDWDISPVSGYVQKGTNTPVTFNYPGAAFTEAYGINDDGQVVRYYCNSTGPCHAFLYNYGGNKSFETFDPTGNGSAAYGINGSGQVVGSFADSTGATHGFIWNAGTDGSDVILPFPYAYSINNNGQVICCNYSIYEEATGSLQTIPIDPKGICCNGASPSQYAIDGINDSAQIVGFYRAQDQNNVTGLVATSQ
jgi:probable HAF family extracellular repeat protein